MSRREISFTMEMAAKRMSQRRIVAGTPTRVEAQVQFTEKENEVLDRAHDAAVERMKERFKKRER